MNIACSSEKNRRLFWQAAVLNLAKRPSRGREALLDLDGADRQLAAARIGLGVELHLLALAQAVDAGALQGGGVDEDVLIAVFRLDEAVATLVVVELYGARDHGDFLSRSEEHTSELQSLMRISYAVFCLKKK